MTRNLSDALSLVKQLGLKHRALHRGLLVPQYCRFCALYAETGCVTARLKQNVAEGQRRYELTRQLALSPLISSPADAFVFHLPPVHPNYITQNCVTGPVSTLEDGPENLKESILFVPSADPGYDWIFSRGIKGFVTKFGGVNSHMAIRAGELSLPAVVGAGEHIRVLETGAQNLPSTAEIDKSSSYHECGCRYAACNCRINTGGASRLS